MIKQSIIRELIEKNEKLNPYLNNMLSVGTERALISVFLTSSTEFARIRNSVSKDDFTDELFKRLFEIIIDISDNRNSGNYVTPEQILYEEKFLEEYRKLNIPDLIEALTIKPYNPLSTQKLIKVIKSKSVQREMWHEQCEQLERLLEFNGEEVDDLVKIGESSVYEIMRKHGNAIDEPYKFGDHTIERLKERESRPTGILGVNFSLYPEFTQMINGGCNTELIVGAARMKEGKSVFLNGLATNIAILGDQARFDAKNQKYIHGGEIIPAGYIDSEMQEDLQEDRSLANLSRIEQLKITNGLFGLNPDDRDKVYEAAAWLKGGQLYWKRIRDFDTQAIIYTAKRMIREQGVRVIFFDQIKDTTDPAGGRLQSTKQRVAWLASCLKFLAEDMNVCVIAMMQLNRTGDIDKLRTEWIDPSLAFADADEVLRFANKGFYLSSMPRAEIDRHGGIGKVGDRVLNLFVNRNGMNHDRQGGIGMLFRKRLTCYEEMTTLPV